MNRIHFKNKNSRKNFVMVSVISVLYFLAFFALEKRQVPIHVIHCALDNIIPFCEYFIIPYYLWFGYVLLTGCYFAFFNEENEEFKSFFKTLIVGMVVFLTVSYFYPNGQLLRPNISGDNIFKQLVLTIYQSDTSTNILPSLHVFYSIACDVALEQHDKIKNNKFFMTGIRILTISIVLSTVFLKQHSAIDVIMALALNGICYHLFYNMGYYKELRAVKSQSKKKLKRI